MGAVKSLILLRGQWECLDARHWFVLKDAFDQDLVCIGAEHRDRLPDEPVERHACPASLLSKPLQRLGAL
jgi:hypothetical protein